MNGKLDITSYGLSEATLHFLKVLAWHAGSYALIVLGAFASGHLSGLLSHVKGNDVYIPLVAAVLNAFFSGSSKWMSLHAPTDNALPSDFVGTPASGING